jgi:hypothetical protein
LQSIIAAQAGVLWRLPSPSGDHNRKHAFAYGATMPCSKLSPTRVAPIVDEFCEIC